jgi:glutamate-1-semialdehyde 2,1-aminomutase
LMSQISPAGPVYQAGTLSGHPVAMAAGLATLNAIEQDTSLYERLEALGAALESGITTATDDACHVARVGSMWTLFFAPAPVTDWTSAARADRVRYGRFFHAVLEAGVSLAPSQFEANFISTAHTPSDIEATVQAVGRAIEASRA